MALKTPYEVVRLQSWEHFISLISEPPYHNWAFRGQRDARAPLFSALSRYLITYGIDPRAWPGQEERILRIFKRKAANFLEHIPPVEDDLQWLALMQDHGAPTRLLDFTWSPYIAAFFALHNATDDAAIWVCNPFEIGGRQKVRIGRGREVPIIRLNPENPGSFRRFYLPGSIPFVWIGEPHVMNRRLIAQSGTFVIPGTLKEPLEDILRSFPNPRNTMIKLILPRTIRERGMQELYRMNITQATLFPDLDGLARSLAFELEFHWRYDPRTMRLMKKRLPRRSGIS